MKRPEIPGLVMKMTCSQETVAWMQFDQVRIITAKEMMPPMLVACPSFQATWEAFVQEWSDEAELPYYLALCDLARHLIGRLEREEVAGFSEVFLVVEDWIQYGDDYVSTAAVVGLLEDMQNSGLHHSTTPEGFRPFLGPLALHWWQRLYDFWDCKRPLGWSPRKTPR